MEYLTVEEVAKELRLSEETVKRMLRGSEMPGYKFGREWRIDRAEFEEWRQRRKNTKPTQEN